MKNNKITGKSDARDIRIYIDGILHIRIPRLVEYGKESIWLSSYVSGRGSNRKLYTIYIHQKGEEDDWYEYDDINIWKSILKLLDQLI